MPSDTGRAVMPLENLKNSSGDELHLFYPQQHLATQLVTSASVVDEILDAYSADPHSGGDQTFEENNPASAVSEIEEHQVVPHILRSSRSRPSFVLYAEPVETGSSLESSVSTCPPAHAHVNHLQERSVIQSKALLSERRGSVTFSPTLHVRGDEKNLSPPTSPVRRRPCLRAPYELRSFSQDGHSRPSSSSQYRLERFMADKESHLPNMEYNVDLGQETQASSNQEPHSLTPVQSPQILARCRSTSALTEFASGVSTSCLTHITSTTCPIARYMSAKTAAASPTLALDNASSETSSLSGRSRSSSSTTLLSDLSNGMASIAAASRSTGTTASPFGSKDSLKAAMSLQTKSEETPSRSVTSRAKSIAAAMLSPLTLAGRHSSAVPSTGFPSAKVVPPPALQPHMQTEVDDGREIGTPTSGSFSPVKRTRSSTVAGLITPAARAHPSTATRNVQHYSINPTVLSSVTASTPAPATPQLRSSKSILSLANLFGKNTTRNNYDHSASMPVTPLTSSTSVFGDDQSDSMSVDIANQSMSDKDSTSPAGTLKVPFDYSSLPVTPLTPEHLRYIAEIAISYDHTAECAPQCKKLCISIRRLSAPVLSGTPSPSHSVPPSPGYLSRVYEAQHAQLPLAYQIPSHAGNRVAGAGSTGRKIGRATSSYALRGLPPSHGIGPRVTTNILCSGQSHVDVMYIDGHAITIDPNECSYELMQSRIADHAQQIASRHRS